MHSASFRIRPCKTPISDPHTTLDTVHQNKLQEFKENRERLPELKNQLKEQREKVEMYEKKERLI